MKIKILLPFLFVGLAFQAAAQLGGLHTFSFLNLSPSARISGLGGNLITVMDDDVNLAYHNPGLLNASMHQQLAFSHGFLFEGIQQGYAGFGHHAGKWNTTFHTGIQYVRYGVFDYTDEFGNEGGTFKAAEYAITLGAARQVDERLSIGANAKLITSQLESYHSLGIAADLAAVYFDTARQLTFTVVMRNVGTQLSTYRSGNREPLPFDFQAGVSKRLQYLPFRFSVIYHHIQRWNLLYDDPNRTESNNIFAGNDPVERSKVSLFFDNFFRHFIFNGELLIGQRESLRLRVGYNHFLRQELQVENYRSLSGFTFGAGIRISRFRLDYGRSNYHLAGGLNHLSISTNLREFRR
jgi:hypothetical protein